MKSKGHDQQLTTHIVCGEGNIDCAFNNEILHHYPITQWKSILGMLSRTGD